MASSPDKFMTVRGGSLRYWTTAGGTSGKNPTKKNYYVVFFHGFSFSLDDWKRIGTLDSVLNSGYAVVALDLPIGKASKSDKVIYENVIEYVRQIRDFFVNLQIVPAVNQAASLDQDKRKQIFLVGPSMGGGFALAYAMAYPEEVAGLILISPSLRTLEEKLLEDIGVPAMLVWGENDNVFPLEEYGRDLRRKLHRSKLVIIKGAGHAAYLDKPEEFNELLLDFLDEIS
jgi:abhydrolase domain-containing protein 14